MRNSITGLVLSFLLVITLLLLSCGPTATDEEKEGVANESAELQPRGNGIVELVTKPVYHGTYSAKLAIPEDYNFSDAARIAIPLDSAKLEGITSVSFWCYIDAETPANVEGYWVPYITFELDTDGEPGCDTWVIGGAGVMQQSSEVWFKTTMDGSWLFHVSSVFSNYTSPFPVSNMGTFTQISGAIGPDGKTPLRDCTVSKLRIAIGNWGEGGPKGPVICYVDELEYNGKLIF